MKTSFNRWVLQSNSTKLESYAKLMEYLSEISSNGLLTSEDIDSCNPKEYGLNINQCSMRQNLSDLKDLGLVKPCECDRGSFTFTDLGRLIADKDNILNLSPRDILARAIKANYYCLIRGNMIQPYDYIMAFLKDLGGRIERIEFLPLFFVSNDEEYQSLLDIIEFYREEQNPLVIYLYLEDLLNAGKITEDDIRIVSTSSFNRPMCTLKSMGFVRETTSQGDNFELPGGNFVRLGKFYSLTPDGYEYIDMRAPDTCYFTDEELDALTEPNVPETEWKVNNLPPRRTTSRLSSYKRNKRIKERCRRNSNGHCFFEGVNLPHDHKVYKSDKGEHLLVVHHTIPFEFQSSFTKNVDTTFLVIPVCYTCHAILHDGTPEEKEILLRFLYDKKRDVLKLYGINSFEEFAALY